MCWICGKAVAPENVQTDEHGSIVHARCHAARVALAKASLDASDNMRRTRLSRRPPRAVLPFSADQQRFAS